MKLDNEGKPMILRKLYHQIREKFLLTSSLSLYHGSIRCSSTGGKYINLLASTKLGRVN